jgi:hypothetical protein
MVVSDHRQGCVEPHWNIDGVDLVRAVKLLYQVQKYHVIYFYVMNIAADNALDCLI